MTSLFSNTVIPGDPAQVGELAQHLTTLANAFERVADGYRRLDTSSWTGQAAEAAREHLDLAPRQWARAADAFHTAGQAVAQYQRTLGDCQPRAQRAQEQLDQATQASKNARQQHNDAVDAAESCNGPPPQPFSDPHAGEIADAQRTIEQCQQAVTDAGDRAAAVVQRAASDAPADPGALTKLAEEFSDGMSQLGRMGGSMLSGVGEGVKGMVDLVRTVNPVDPQALADPAGKAEGYATLAAGLGGTAIGLFTNPKETISTLVDAETWKNNPAKAAGKLVPDIALGVATGGSGTAASRGAQTASRAAKAGEKAAKNTGETAKRAGEKLRPAEGNSAPTPPVNGTPPWQGRDLPPETPSRSTGSDHPTGIGEDGRTPSTDPNVRPSDGEAQSLSPRDTHMDPAPEQPGPRPEGRDVPRRPMPDEFDNQPASFLEQVGKPGGADGLGGRLDHLGGEHTPEPHARPDEPGPGPRADSPDPHTRPDEPSPHDRPSQHDQPDRLSPDEHGPQDRHTPDEEGLTPDDREFAEMRRSPELIHLSDREILSLSDYRGGGFNDLNAHLRGHDGDINYPDTDFDGKIHDLDTALDKAPKYDGGPVHRGFPVSESKIDDVLAKYEPGQVVHEPAYTSTSADGPWRGNVEMVIESKQGHDLRSMSSQENEVLFPRDTEFRVTERTYDPDTDTWEIHLTDP